MDTLLHQFASTTTLEALAAALGLAYLLLAVRRNLLCWLCAFASSVLSLWVVLRASLYMQVALNAFYLAMAVYGFIEWRRGRSSEGEVMIASWTPRQHGLAAALIVAAALVNGWLLSGTHAAQPYLDSLVTWGSVVATWMVARRVIENWLYWIVFDGLAAYLYFTQGLLALTILFVIYLGVVIRGYFTWRREQQQQRAAAAPRDGAATDDVTW